MRGLLWVTTIEASDLYARRHFNDGLRNAVEVEGTVVAVPRAKLLAGHVEHCVLAVAHEERLPSGAEEDLAAFNFVDLNLISSVHHYRGTVL